ncbi:MAG: glycine cleavage system aminomethyltransferase GcvT [Armatimonadota bacterium]|nr:glycine cleavage system aminomethyltransferase GcvT [Armatimonadota bacterium]
MKRTSLHETHRAAGATMVPFAGWDMPVSYSGTVGEVAAVRSGAGLFDVSHMGEVTATGLGAFEFVQSVTSNDVSKLTPGKAQYSLLLNETGGIIDDIIIYCRAEADYLIVLNAGCKDKDWAWLQAEADGRPSLTLTDISDKTALIAVQGPQAVSLVSALADGNLEPLGRFHFAVMPLLGSETMFSRTGYTGEDGFEIFCDWAKAPALWKVLTERGALPAGLGARDVLRLEAAYPLYGHELDAETGPFESGVGWAVKRNKGRFIGSDALPTGKPPRRLVGLRMNERAIPREHYAVHDTEGQEVGQTTSGTWSPTVKAGIAMARLHSNLSEPGTSVTVDIRGRRAPATVVSLPFYRNGV